MTRRTYMLIPKLDGGGRLVSSTGCNSAANRQSPGPQAGASLFAPCAGFLLSRRCPHLAGHPTRQALQPNFGKARDRRRKSRAQDRHLLGQVRTMRRLSSHGPSRNLLPGLGGAGTLLPDGLAIIWVRVVQIARAVSALLWAPWAGPRHGLVVDTDRVVEPE